MVADSKDSVSKRFQHSVVAGLAGVAIGIYLFGDMFPQRIFAFVVSVTVLASVFAVSAALFGERFLKWSQEYLFPYM